MDILEDKFIRIAHRGASGYEPENTVKSFEKAIELNADMIEFDVRESLDGHLVVMHDETVDRTTSGTGPVSMKTLSELKDLDAGEGQQIPMVEEILEFGKDRTKFVLELKQDGVEDKVVSLLNKYDLLDDVYIVSFKPRRLKMIKELEPRLKMGLIILAAINPVKLTKDCGADFMAPYHKFISKSLIDNAKESGLYTFTWTVDEYSKAQSLREKGVSGIVTNKPDII